MTIAIMGAMPEEIEPFLSTDADEPLLEFFEVVSKKEYAGNRYYESKYKEHNVVLAYSKIGKVNAALTATVMIEHFGASILLFSGVAGGINETLQIGDLIAASKLCQHDLDITAFGHPHGYVPEGAVFIEPSRELIAMADAIALEKGIVLKEGVIATGDQFVANEAKKSWIQKEFQADALEMEGAAVAVVCDAYNIPFFIMRSISDTADMDATFNFDTFLKHSAKQSSGFIMAMLDKIVDGKIK